MVKYVSLNLHSTTNIHLLWWLILFCNFRKIDYEFIAYYLLQWKSKAWQGPFHLLGGELNPISLKLWDSGQIPWSITPIIMSLSGCALSTFIGKPIKSQDFVVRTCFFSLGKTDTTPSCTALPILMVNKHTNI